MTSKWPKRRSKKRIRARKSHRNYDDAQYKAWRSAVRKRDGHKCQWPNCGAKKKLQVHHILKWATHPTLRYDERNGITLCRKHHDKINKKEEFYIVMFKTILSKIYG